MLQKDVITAQTTSFRAVTRCHAVNKWGVLAIVIPQQAAMFVIMDTTLLVIAQDMQSWTYKRFKAVAYGKEAL
jgi:hypothetical protein